jgi:hypothetical protein
VQVAPEAEVLIAVAELMLWPPMDLVQHLEILLLKAADMVVVRRPLQVLMAGLVEAVHMVQAVEHQS